MRPIQNELYEDWCQRSRQHELDRAIKLLNKDALVEEILDNMSQRLLNKLMDPLYEIILNEISVGYDTEKSQLEYKNSYLDKVDPVPDHVIQE